jgi:hypothetical protein
MTLDNSKNTMKIEYEGQSYTVDAAKIEGLDDEQIISLLSVGAALAQTNAKQSSNF